MVAWAALVPLIGNVLDRVLPDEAAREKAKLEMLTTLQGHEGKILEHQMSAILAEANSNDPWTSRARPAFLYLMYAIIGLTFVGGIIGIWHPEEMRTAAENIKLLFGAIPDALYALFGTGYLGYSAARTWDKSNIMKASKDKLPWQ